MTKTNNEKDTNKQTSVTEVTTTVTPAKDMSLSSSKNPTAHTTTARHTTTVQYTTSNTYRKEKENENGDVWMQRFTPSTFSKMHAQIYPIIATILFKPEYTHHHFQTNWNTIHSDEHKPTMTSKMSWRQMTQCLGISDFSQYKDFVYKCPEINTKIKIIAHKSTIEFGIISTSTNHTDITKEDKIESSPLQPTRTSLNFISKCGSRTLHGHKTTNPTQPFPI